MADLTGLDIDAKPEEGKVSTVKYLLACTDRFVVLRQLVLLNTILHGQEGITESIAKQRLIFFVKHVVPWLQDLNIQYPIRAEVCRALSALLPLMSDIYGEHWGDILNAVAVSWDKTTALTEKGHGMDR